MKTHQQLTPRGKLRRLRGLAKNALAQYNIDVVRYNLISYETNLIYRVYTHNGPKFALRLTNSNWRTLGNLQSEVMWLDALACDTDINVPHIIKTADGAGVITTNVTGVPQTYYALLMSWLPGTLLGKKLTTSNLIKMGELFGRLHLHSATWKPPKTFNSHCFNQIFSRGESNIIFSEPQLNSHSTKSLQIIQQIQTQVDAVYAAFSPNDLQVIHCDLWHDNIKLYQGKLSPFDFEDTIWGYRLHDIAMAMLDLAEEVGLERYEQLLEAFQQGYERHLAWPSGNLTLLQLGRMLWRINYIAHFERKWLTESISFYTDLFERYLTHGKLIAPLRPN